MELIGCFSVVKFQPNSWAGFISALVTSRTKAKIPAFQSLMRTWLGSQSLQLSGNLAWFSRQHYPVLIASSPWDSRPLGRPLPDINITCSCRTLGDTSIHRQWKAYHTAKAGMLASAVDLRIECAACRRCWQLPTSTSLGRIHEYAGFFAVEIPLNP